MLIITVIVSFYGVLNWFLMGEIFSGDMEKGAKALSNAMFLIVVIITGSIAVLTMEDPDDSKKQSS